PPSILIGEATHQELASGYPIGKRFKSATVVRVADTNPVQLGHHHRADGRWRIYAFADTPGAGAESTVAEWAEWMATSPGSPLLAHTPADGDIDSVFDIKVVYQQPHTDLDIGRVPRVFLPRTGPFELIDYEKVYASDPKQDIFDLRGIDRGGVVVVVRPDQYVAQVLPLAATEELAAFFRPILSTTRVTAH
ncbi:MAG: 3-hydroxybenzoate 4-monooxygenase, partial [Leifsonia sp.]